MIPVTYNATTIALVMKALSNPFFIKMEQGAKEEAALFGMELIVKDAANNESQQLMDIVSLKNRRVDAIIVNPTSAEALIPGIDMARLENIPVITVDRKISEGKIIGHVDTVFCHFF